ncbi:MAG: glutamate racemase [Planctomycetes bacterium]|jgi:glutamate racemase|nr:glutamate racemase [Planctomycetota bacterium]
MIGVFDSGLGGLTVLRELLRELPQYDYAYLGDNARAPYGNKSQTVIYGYALEAVDFLFKQGCGLAIIACNTASAKALRRLQREWLPQAYPGRRVLGVVIPAAEIAAAELKTGKNKKPIRLGVIGTRSTIESAVYETEIKKTLAAEPTWPKQLEIYAQACPLLVPLVEEGWTGKPETKTILKKYLRPLKEKKISVLILGCTHYPFLAADIGRIMGKGVKIIDTPRAVAVKLKSYLRRHPEIESQLKKNGGIKYFTSDEPGRFKTLAQKFIGGRISEVIKAEL